MKAWLIRGVVVLAAFASAAFAADPPRFQVTTVVPYGGYCSRARAINEVGDVLYDSCGTVLAWNGVAQKPVVLLAKSPGGIPGGCVNYYASGRFNNARQFVGWSDDLSHCGIGGSSRWYVIVYGVTTGSFDYYTTSLSAINGAGEIASNRGGNYVVSPDPADWNLASGGAPGSVTALNDSGQALVRTIDQGTAHAALVDLASGTIIFQTITSNAAMNARGWVAGADASTHGVFLWDGNDERALGVPLTPDNSNVLVKAISNDGWILGSSDRGFWLWMDEAFYRLDDQLLTPLPAGVKIQEAFGFSQAGAIAVTVASAPYSSDSSSLLITPINPPPPPDTVLKRDAGPQMDGTAESVSCDGLAGWIINRDHPKLNVTVELYDGTRIIGGAVSGSIRGDGTHDFKIAIPQAYHDGQAHDFNLRFGGTATIVNQASATLSCDP